MRNFLSIPAKEQNDDNQQHTLKIHAQPQSLTNCLTTLSIPLIRALENILLLLANVPLQVSTLGHMTALPLPLAPPYIGCDVCGVYHAIIRKKKWLEF